MPSKKVLIITYYFPPYAGGGVYRALKFVKHLPAYGWKPIVIAPEPKRYYWAFDFSLLQEVPDDVQVYRTLSWELFYLFALLDKIGLPKAEDLINEYALVPDEKIGWIPATLVKALRLVRSEHIDVIFTSSPPNSVHLIGYLLKKLTGKPWVADFRDQWTDNPHYTSRSKMVKTLNVILEQAVYQACDRVVQITYTDGPRISRRFGVPMEKIVTIPNGYDEADFLGKPRYEHRDDFIVTYFGSFYGAREKTVEVFLKGMELAIQKNRRLSEKARIVFCGNTRIHDGWLQHPIMGKMLSAQGYVSHNDAIEKMLMSDVLLLVFIANRKNVISTRLFEYMATGKPVLALISESEAKTILSKANLGFFADPSDPASIGDAIINLFERRERGNLVMEPNWEYIRQFKRKKLTGELASLLNQLLPIV
jgi:glycosyltransferase involved in cell wall biosynthesis